MRPLQCHAGFPVPIGAGKYEVCGVSAVVSDTAAAARLTLIDDVDLPRDSTVGRVLTEDGQKVTFIDLKGLANAHGNLVEYFFESVKMNKGISVTNASNLIGGKVILFVR